MFYRLKRHFFLLVLLLSSIAPFAFAQTTEFTYQGRLTDNSVAANGNYDFEFRLFNVASGGAALGALTRLGVPLSNGIFTVNLDFAATFDGQPRWLEIAVRPAGSAGGYQQLLPRQPVASAPYSIKSLNSAASETATNANQLGGVPANQYVQTNDSRLSDARNPLAGSAHYIQNRTTQQAASNFNVPGDGTAGGTLTASTVRANTQYNLGDDRTIWRSGSSFFVGAQAGNNNTTGSNNAFFGISTGFSNTIGGNNSFFGFGVGNSNTEGSHNSFFGSSSGSANTLGDSNAFFGSGSGARNVDGSENSFFGAVAGQRNVSGAANSFFGYYAGFLNSAGARNVFVGHQAGDSNVIGSNNTIVGADADVANTNLTYATAIGSDSSVSTSNTIVLGRTNGLDKVRVFGLGSAGSTQLCRNASNEISTCSSSLRYKTDITPFNFGLNLVNRLRPIAFNWKDGGTADFGLGAEDVAAIEPLLVTYNKDGQVEGVKYDRLGVVLLNAVREQQQIIEQQQQQIEALKKLVCQQNPQAETCLEVKK